MTPARRTALLPARAPLRVAACLVWLMVSLNGFAQEALVTDDPLLVVARDEANRLADAQRWEEAIAAAGKLLTLCRERLGPEHATVAVVETFLARARTQLGELALAEAHFRRALAIREQTLDPNDPVLAGTLSQLGRCLRDEQRLDEAVPPLERALQICRDALGGEAPGTIAALDDLAQLQTQRGTFTVAEKLAAERLDATEKHYGPASPETATALTQLAAAATRQGHDGDAEPRYRRALAIREKTLPPDDLARVASLTDLGWCLKNMGRYDAAQPLLQRALDWTLQFRGPGHEETAASSRSLGWIFRLKQDFAAAQPLFVKALEIRERTLGSAAPPTLQSLVELADLHWLRGAYDLAESLYLQRRERVAQRFGPRSEELAAAEYSLALLYESAQRWPEARTAAERVLALHTEQLGADDSQTMGNVFVLARILFGAGDFSGARQRYADIAAWFEIHPQADAARHSETLRQLAAAAFRAGPAAEAEPFFQAALRWHEATLSPTDPATLACLGDLWTYYEATGRPSAALEIAQDLTGRIEQAFAPDAPATLTVLEHLARLHETLSHRTEATALHQRVLDATRRRTGADSQATLDALERLAGWLERGAEFAAAEPLRLERWQIIERKSGPESAATASALGDLAAVRIQLRQFNRARAALERRWKILEKLPAEQRTALPALASQLGEVCAAAGDLDATLQWRERAVKLIGTERSESVAAQLQWAEALARKGALDRSAEIFATARRLALAAQPPQDQLAVRAACGLAGLALRQGRTESANGAWQEAESLLRQVSEPDPALAPALVFLGEAFREHGDEPRRIAAFRAALAIYEMRKDPPDSQIVEVWQELGKLAARGHEPGAADLLEQALAASDAVYGTENPRTLEVLNGLLLARLENRQFAEAQPAAERLLRGRLKMLGEQNAETGLAHALRGWVAVNTGDLATAAPEFRAAAALASSVLGPAHPLLRALRLITPRLEVLARGGEREW